MNNQLFLWIMGLLLLSGIVGYQLRNQQLRIDDLEHRIRMLELSK